MLREANGKLSLVGTGPGDAELLTLKALRLIEDAQVIFYDRTVAPEILALSDPTALLIYTATSEHEGNVPNGEVLELMRIHARAGHRVARLLGGDAWMLGPGPAEAALLRQAGIEVEVVPGVNAVLAAPAIAGIPFAPGGGGTFAVIAGEAAEEGWGEASGLPSLVVWQGDEPSATLARRLMNAGRSATDAVALLPRGCNPEGRGIITELGELRRGAVVWEGRGVWVLGEGVRQHTALRLPVGTSASPKD